MPEFRCRIASDRYHGGVDAGRSEVFGRRYEKFGHQAAAVARRQLHPSGDAVNLYVMNKLLSALLWAAIAAAGAAGFAVLALHRGETVSAAWMVIAAVCTYVVGYRFYSRFIAQKIMALDDRRATAAERSNNG